MLGIAYFASLIESTSTPLAFHDNATIRAIYYINKDEDVVRRKHMESEFSDQFGLQRVPAMTPEKDGCSQPYGMRDCCTQSHLSLWKSIVAATSTQSTWSVVLEDDVTIHTKVKGWNLTALMTRSLNFFQQMGIGFVYLTLCGNDDDVNRIKCSRQGSMQFGGNFVTLGICRGKCTSAYAINSNVIARLLAEIEAISHRVVTIDEALKQLPIDIELGSIGNNLVSPDNAGHIGILYQPANALLQGTAITNSANSVSVSVLPSGRFGNLMFEWDAMLGLAKRIGARTLLGKLPNSRFVPAQVFVRTFALKRLSRCDNSIDMAQIAGMRKGMGFCDIRVFKEKHPNRFDVELVRSVETFKCTCGACLIILDGYFQSWRYHHPGVQYSSFLRVRVSDASVVDAFMASLRAEHIVGVQCRFGDKMLDYHKPIYAQLGLPYYLKAMSIMKERLKGLRVLFVLTTGGSYGGNQQDLKYTTALFDNQSVSFTGFDREIYDFNFLQKCDSIITGASSFGWYAAISGNHRHVIVPKQLYNETHELSKAFSASDYYPPTWTQI